VVDVVLAPAKLTVSLRITGVRDDGYHLIDAEMVSIDLADELQFAEGDGLEVVGATGLAVPADDLPHVDRTFTLVTPPFGCATPAVYRAWDDLGGPSVDGPNDLEAAALVVAPELAGWRDRLAEATGQVPVLAGSGSTWFVDGAFPGAGLVVHAVAEAGLEGLGTSL